MQRWKKRSGLAGVVVSAGVLAWLAGGCSSAPPAGADAEGGASAGLAARGGSEGGPGLGVSPDELLAGAEGVGVDEQIAETAALFRALREQGIDPATGGAEGAEASRGGEDAGAFGLLALSGGEEGGADVGGADVEKEEPAPAAEPEAVLAEAGAGDEVEDEAAVVVEATPEERVMALLDEAVGVLKGGPVWATEPFREAMARTLLGAIRGEAEAGGALPGPLTPTEQAAVEGVAVLVRALLEDEASPSADRVRGVIEEAFGGLAERATETRPVEIARTELCSRVTGFGEFDRLGTTRFLAGELNKMIVYVELEHLRVRHLDGLAPDGTAARTGVDDRRYVVETSIQVQLFEPGGLNVWNTPTETYRRETRTPVRDNHRIRVLALPPNLGVGRYDMKIVVRDEIGGSLAEAVVPIELVADRKLLSAAPAD